MFSFGYFPGVWVLMADVSEHSIGSIFIGRSMKLKNKNLIFAFRNFAHESEYYDKTNKVHSVEPKHRTSPTPYV
jgi:hypothetical protein